jgi:multidrug efflux pump subunit AcrA (membrane-fusion protein)
MNEHSRASIQPNRVRRSRWFSSCGNRLPGWPVSLFILWIVLGSWPGAAIAQTEPPPEVTVTRPAVREATGPEEFAGRVVPMQKVEIKARVIAAGWREVLEETLRPVVR